MPEINTEIYYSSKQINNKFHPVILCIIRSRSKNQQNDYKNTGCVSESGDFATLFFSGLATLGRTPLSPFCCQL
jgi:hypothetical protein